MQRLRRSLLGLAACCLCAVALAAAAAPAAVSAQAVDNATGRIISSGNVIFKPSIYFPGLETLSEDWQTTGIVVTPTTLGQYIVTLYRFFTGATAIVALFMVTYGGFLWLLAGGNQGSISHAKEVISGAIAGMVIALLSYALLATISRGLVEFKSLDTKLEAPLGLPGEEAEFGRRQAYSVMPTRENFEGRYGAIFAAAASSYSVDCTWLKAHALAESSGNPTAQSPAGACGIMQVMPSTADLLISQGLLQPPTGSPAGQHVTCDDLKDPIFGIFAGAAYVSTLRSPGHYQQDYQYCRSRGTTLKPQTSWTDQDKIAAYNGGVGANCLSRTCQGQTYWACTQNLGYSETRGYVGTVQAFYQQLADSGRACE